jgi:hypothetical protein
LAASIHTWLVAHTVVPARDSVGFIRYAWQLQHQSWLEVLKTSHQHPGYPVAILAASIPIRHFRGNSQCDAMVLSAQLVNWLAGCLLVIPMFYLGKELFNRRVGFGTAALFQCLPVAARVTSDGLSEGIFLLIAAVTLLVGFRAFRYQSVWRFALCGWCGGLCYLIRPEGALPVAAVALVLVGTRLVPKWRWPWSRTLFCTASLGLAAVAMAAPYIAVIGQFTNKPTGQAVMDIACQESLNHGETTTDKETGRQGDKEIREKTLNSVSPCLPVSPPPCLSRLEVGEGPLFASLLGAWLPNERETGWWRHFRWGLWAVGKEVIRGFFYIAWLPAVLGLFWFNPRFRDRPGAWIFGGLCLLQTLVLWRVGLVVGYVSERHILIIVLCGLYWAVAAIEEIPRRWPRTLQWLGNARTQPVLVMLVLTISCLPWTLQPLHANQVGHREAGLWLAGHARPADTIMDPFNWAYYYSGRVFQEDILPSTPPEQASLRYVVLEHSRQQHAGLTYLPLAQQAAIGGRVVFDWQPNRHQLKHKAQEVQIFAVPLVKR